MGFLKRLLTGQNQQETRSQPPPTDLEEVNMALYAFERAQYMDSIEQKINSLLQLLSDETWNSAIKDGTRSAVSYRDVSWEFGDYIQDVSELDSLQSMVPEDISRGMPPNVKKNKVKQFWFSVSMQSLETLSQLVDKWSTHFAHRIDSSEPDLATWYDLQLKYCVHYLNYSLWDTRATIALWNERQDAEARNRQIAQSSLEDGRSYLAMIQAVVSRATWDETVQYAFTSYTDEMWEFLGMKRPNP